ncbi:AEC family transporter [Phaeovibrio sulfidiphilus]|uniref:AEC family transporter n=1 Tax=Phaeovibrio sulfidiphilus TaxID=1220600 RepID=A0A8J6YQ27_9PROT|nr:AEC family transporter [Phaeovibrio sulfidiphilus]MBE1237616.1 AEC family transporter [Phaeovibrio sulfidiphilus]
MLDSLLTALSFITIIVIGYVIKRLKVVSAENFAVLSRIVIHITLPCAIVTNLDGVKVGGALLVLIPLGFAANLVMIAIAFLVSRGKTAEQKAFSIMTLSGFNVGSFSFPYVQAFLPPTGFLAAALFDAGNAVMVSGGSYAVARGVLEPRRSFSLVNMLRGLWGFFAVTFSSLPFFVYVVMIPLCLLGLSLPEPVTRLTSTIGAANTFLSMLMLGIGVEFHLNRERLKAILFHLGVRYFFATLLALGAWYLLPFDHDVRLALTTICFAPTSTIGLVFTARLGCDLALASNINSLSILISVVIMTVLMTTL